jgi:hypothetical protein
MSATYEEVERTFRDYVEALENYEISWSRVMQLRVIYEKMVYGHVYEHIQNRMNMPLMKK